jgi:opacity protein-like surface antigen
MKSLPKYFVVLAFFYSSHTICAQNFYVTGTYGASGYRGDLQEIPLSMLQARIAWGIGCNIQINGKVSVDLDYTNAKLSGNDRYNPFNRKRNLSFKSNTDAITLKGNYDFFDINNNFFSPYVFAGISYFKFSPYIDLENGSRIYLQEYATEGQGFFQNRVPYSLNEWSFPFGAGLHFAFSKKFQLKLFAEYRPTTTDYLDDVSTTYVDKNQLIFYKGLNAPSIAYKGDLLPNGDPYPSAGTTRGNPDDNDSYFIAGATILIKMTAKGRKKEFIPDGRPARLDCPKF